MQSTNHGALFVNGAELYKTMEIRIPHVYSELGTKCRAGVAERKLNGERDYRNKFERGSAIFEFFAFLTSFGFALSRNFCLRRGRGRGRGDLKHFPYLFHPCLPLLFYLQFIYSTRVKLFTLEIFRKKLVKCIDVLD